MLGKTHLTYWARAVRGGACVVLLTASLTTACQKNSVTDLAQTNQPAAAATVPPAPNSAVATGAVPSPTVGNPAAIPGPGQAPVQVGIAPDYQPQASPAPGTTPSPGASVNAAPNMRHLNNSKVTMVNGIAELPTPPPTPTPTPAVTPPVELVNGKIKQQWEAPAEFAAMKNPVKVTPDVIKRGKYLYQTSCELCHGAEGKGNGAYNSPQWKQATNLTSKVVQANTDGELFYKVSNSRDRHPSKKVMYSDEERWMIVAFLRTLK
ncbi:MAG TPA: c-type cytochrome [Blastocatellia bacterium]|nr:c-type cytochrome [Blastocatellia bacterium]